MNIYRYHEKPSILDHFDVRHKLSPELAWSHGKQTGEWFEDAIARSPYYSWLYAEKILKGPFKLGEPAIAREPLIALQYALDIIEGPFPLGEPAIAKDLYTSKKYLSILNRPFKLAEPTFAKDAEGALWYAKYGLNGRFKQGEPEIAKDGSYSFSYAKDVLKARFPLGEPAIAEYTYLARDYNKLFGTNL